MPSPSHTYTAGGVYTVTLTVEGPGGIDTLTTPDCITVYAPPEAGSAATPAAGVPPLLVAFENTTTGDYTSSEWDFGDTVTSTVQSPLHLYTAPGLYTVRLTVDGPGGSDTKVATGYIDVYPPRPEPGAADTDLVLQHLGAQPALMAVALATAGTGAPAWSTYLPAIAPRAPQALPAAGFGGAAAGAWAGAGDVASSEPLAALVNVRWGQAAASYAGVTEAGTAAYLPLLVKAPGHETELTVQNGEDAQATVTVRFYDRAGTLAGTKVLAVPAGSEVTLALTQVPEADFSASGGLGAAVVTASGAVAAVARVHWPHASDAYSSLGAGATTLLAPGALRKELDDGRWDYSELVVQNLAASAAGVKVEFVAHDGTLSHALDDTIPAHGGAAYSTRQMAALGEDWQGTIRVTSGQPLAGVCTAWLPAAAVADNLAASAATATARSLAFPDVHRQVTGAEDDAWSLLLVHNAAAAAGSVFVEFYGASGKVGGTYVVAVPAGGLARLSLLDGLDLPQAALGALGTAFTGSAWITPSPELEIVGLAETVWPGEGRAAAYAGFAAPWGRCRSRRGEAFGAEPPRPDKVV